MVKDMMDCLRLCTCGRGLQVDARGLVQASNSMGSDVLVLGLNGKLMVVLTVASMTKVGKVSSTLSLIAISEQP